MATKKFATPSPYVQRTANPDADFVFKNFVKNTTAKQSPAQMAKPLGCAIFGLGRAGSIHLTSLVGNPRVQLKYVIDDVVSKWDDLRKYWNFGPEVTFLSSKDSDRVFKDSAVDIVVVASPTYTHENIVTKALESKKNVFCEKPIAEDIETSVKLYAKAKTCGRTLFSAFNRRFDPAYRSLKDSIRNGDIGHVQILKVTSRDSPLPTIDYLKNSGGVFHDCLVHDFDMSCWVLGELPIKVQATASSLVPEIKAIDDFDTIAFLLTFPSGSIAIGDNSRYSCYGYDQRLEAFGAKGMVKVENERPCPSTEWVLGQDGQRINPIYYSFPSRYQLAYKNEMEHFLDVVQLGVEVEVKSWQSLAITKIATAAEESARTGKTVFLDWSKDELPENYA